MHEKYIDEVTKHNWSEQFARNLRRERRLNRMSADKLAEVCGISLSHYRNLESNQGIFPSYVLLVCLMIHLKCGPDRLFYGIVPMPKEREDDIMMDKMSGLRPHQKQQVYSFIDMFVQHNGEP